MALIQWVRMIPSIVRQMLYGGLKKCVHYETEIRLFDIEYETNIATDHNSLFNVQGTITSLALTFGKVS